MNSRYELSRRHIIQLSALGLAGIPALGRHEAIAQDAPGSELIGQLEGPQIITDPAAFPTTFNEAPQLAELVAQGALPSVEERIGQDPLVLAPVHEIGQYGGTWRRGFTGPGDRFNGWRVASGTDALLYYDHTTEHIVPNIARAWEVSEDGRQVTVSLRRGMHWSDGAPFTADDILFWYVYIYGNAELTPAKTQLMSINAQEGTIEKVDDHTIRFTFADPYYLLPELLAGHTDLGGHASQGLYGNGLFAPAHYLKGFHPSYTPVEELDAKIAESGLDSWTLLFLRQNDWTVNTELPTLSPWMLRSPSNTATWALERNPYSIWVDTDGNQLPYIDEIVMTLAEDNEVLNLRAVAGEYDFQARSINLLSLPILLENQEQGDYTVSLDPGNYGSDQTIAFNLSYQADPEIARLIGTTDFRRALSLGVDRDQLNETYWLGLGTPGTMAPIETNVFSPGPEYRTMWATYEPDRANQMLDALGMVERDGEGFRLRTDNGERLRLEIQTGVAGLMPGEQIAEMVVQQWREIGIYADVRALETTAGSQRTRANEHQMGTWLPDGNENLWIYPGMTFSYWMAQTMTGPLHAQWYQSNGAQGLEPPEWLSQVYTEFRRGYGVPLEERIPLGQNIWRILIDEVAQIGLVGLSPASMGVRVVKNNMDNVPGRIYNGPASKNPAIARTQTFYFMS
ncbi:MAG: ABC transporter substrate-binding protein [Chloroflexia bacterium]|nr:ABC transporter substrate-binding protein [Chloroflexia bacterium]